MNNAIGLWTGLLKEVGSTYAESYGILSDQQDGFRLARSIHKALTSFIMMPKYITKRMYYVHRLQGRLQWG
jgi:hypothetical protein